jgi:hypothetical protein
MVEFVRLFRHKFFKCRGSAWSIWRASRIGQQLTQC